jgi:aminoglycoside phosphotransferase (APT) family kinase protein
MGMHADEAPTSAALVRRLVAEQLPHWAGLPVEPVASFGTDHALYRLGDELVARLPRREVNVLSLEKERAWLPRLAPLLPLAVPVPLADGGPGAGYPFTWSVYRWLDGDSADVAPPADLTQAATDLAGFIAALQRIDASDGPRPGAHNGFRGEPLARRDESTRTWLATLRGVVDTRAALAVWEEGLEAPEWERAPIWLHGDLDRRNLLVTGGRLSGVIDFGCLGVGDPAWDVAAAWKVLDAPARDVLRAALDVDDATGKRARGWVVWQAVGALSYYSLETNRALFTEARLWLDEVLTTARR